METCIAQQHSQIHQGHSPNFVHKHIRLDVITHKLNYPTGTVTAPQHSNSMSCKEVNIELALHIN